MSLPKIVSHEEWTAARRELLQKEKDLTQRRDRLNTERRELPMVAVTKPYDFEGPRGARSLLELFEGRPQLIVYYRTLDQYAAMGEESMKTAAQPYDMPGRTCFLAVDGTVYRTYSVYARGLESTGGSYYFLDLTALGRQEDWEQPAGRSPNARRNHPDFAS